MPCFTGKCVVNDWCCLVLVVLSSLLPPSLRLGGPLSLRVLDLPAGRGVKPETLRQFLILSHVWSFLAWPGPSPVGVHVRFISGRLIFYPVYFRSPIPPTAPPNRPSQPSLSTIPCNHPLQPSLQSRTCLLPLVHCPLLLFLTNVMNLLRRNASHLFSFLYCLFFNTRSVLTDPFPTGTSRRCVIILPSISSMWKKI